MPKIIQGLKEQLLEEAKRQISERGYGETTMRSVASACGVGVGTVYNYFPSKEMLVATFVLEDWKCYLAEMRKLPSDQPKLLLGGICAALNEFSEKHATLFSDIDASKLMSVGFSVRHKLLRGQISELIFPLVADAQDPRLSADFIAEALISWSMEKVCFDTVYPIFEKIIKN